MAEKRDDSENTDLPTGNESTVTLPDASDDADDAPPERSASGGSGKPSRAGGFRALKEEFERFRRDGVSSAVSSATAPLIEQVRALNERIAEMGRARPAEPKQDDTVKQFELLDSQLRSLISEASRTDLSAERRQEITANFTNLQNQKAALQNAQMRAEIVAEMEKKFGGGANRQSDAEPMIQRAYGMLQDDHPEFFMRGEDFTQKAMLKIAAYVNHEVTVEERPKTLALYKEAAAHVKSRLGLGDAGAPERDRRALATPGRGHGGGGSGGRRSNGEVPKVLASAFQNATGGSLADMAKYLSQQPDDN